MQLALSAGNLQPVPSAGKRATGAKRGKTWQPVPTRENKQPQDAFGVIG